MSEALVHSLLRDSAAVKQAIINDAACVQAINRSAERMVQVVREGGTIFSCGNGGSACDAMHFTEELVSRYKRERPGIRAMHFLDPSALSCWANDYKFDGVFERQAQTFCTARDLLVALSTSGNSKNVIAAVRAARAKGCACIGLTGKNGGALAGECDETIIVPSNETERIQEAHITIIHIWCELIERTVFGGS